MHRVSIGRGVRSQHAGRQWSLTAVQPAQQIGTCILFGFTVTAQSRTRGWILPKCSDRPNRI